MARKTALFLLAVISGAILSGIVPSAQVKAPDVLFIERFSTEAGLADSGKKAERIEDIPESKLIQIQEVLQSEIGKSKMFAEVRILKSGEKPQLKEGQTGWVLGGQFLDYKKGNKAARYFIGMGAGKQKVEVMVEVRDVATGATVRKERVVDRKVGGWFGGDDEKGLRDFAERIVELLKKAKTGEG